MDLAWRLLRPVVHAGLDILGLVDDSADLPDGEEGDNAQGGAGEEGGREARQPGRGGRRGVALSAAAICVGAVVLGAALQRGRRRRAGGWHGDGSRPPRTDRIPLKDVIRFKERQWFVEELENSRDGDANAMLRLAKMYLHGQGCQRNAAVAQEWLKKARYLGVGGTLDELYATDDPDPRSRLRAMLAEDDKRLAARSRASSSAAGGQPQPPRLQEWRP